MPNPLGEKPGPLGTDPKAEANYYTRYFDGKDRVGLDGAKIKPKPVLGPDGSEEFREDPKPRPKRVRINPKEFWYKPDYVTPDPANVGFMSTKELKYAMINEAHQVMIWREQLKQDDGPASGLPPNGHELWMAFGYRAADLATAPAAGAKFPMGASVASPDEEGISPRQRCSVRSCMRFLQALSSVQAGPFSALQRIVGRVLQELDVLKPTETFYLLQALARLRLRHTRSSQLLQKMHLAWRILPQRQLVKAANAAAKLDLASGMWARPLKAALSAMLPRLEGRHLANLKSIAVMELLNTPAGLTSYLDLASSSRSSFRYSRHLLVVEMHVHLLWPDVWNSLDEHIKAFLEEVRKTFERVRQNAGSKAETSSDESDDEDDEMPNRRRSSEKGYDPRLYSSQLHQDVSRILSEHIALEHNSRLAAGTLTVDMCHVPTMTIIEAAAAYQFYLRSSKVTALARRRQEMLRAMGFKLIQVPYYRWDVLGDDEAKAGYLRDLLPPELLAHAKTQRLPS
eukprot:TRINITY_DN34147_c0_g1_i2.p1 TRINITY_DN34147_c0_g1~~TRINITY_DN34147_c0_g1_i2.p1  ORF type:complete len:513 (-),score=124.93 TRINITY_DN34147_c0_g1_i2:395-1933(-)